MKAEFTSAVGFITGEIKNNPSIYVSKNQFAIFLNGELIVLGTCNDPEMSEKNVFEYARKVLEDLKFGRFKISEVQKRFDSFIRA